MHGHVKRRKTRTQFLEFCRYLRSLYPPQVRIAIICDSYFPHLITRRDKRVANWAAVSSTEIAYLTASSSWMNRIEAQFTGKRGAPGGARDDYPVTAHPTERTKPMTGRTSVRSVRRHARNGGNP
jgi:hypothetical protein